MLGLGNNIMTSSVTSEFLPTDIANLQMWLQNGVGVAVGQWDDSSGNSNHVTQESSGNQAAVSNGGLAFTAENEDQYVFTSDIEIAERGSVNIFAVIELGGTVSNRTLVGTGANADFMEFLDEDTIRFHFDNSGGAEKIDFGSAIFAADNKFLIHHERIQGATGTLNTQIDGSTVSPSGFAAGDGADAGAFVLDRIGARNDDRFMEGTIFELLIYKNDAADMADADIVLVNDYLKTKHGL